MNNLFFTSMLFLISYPALARTTDLNKQAVTIVNFSSKVSRQAIPIVNKQAVTIVNRTATSPYDGYISLTCTYDQRDFRKAKIILRDIDQLVEKPGCENIPKSTLDELCRTSGLGDISKCANN